MKLNVHLARFLPLVLVVVASGARAQTSVGRTDVISAAGNASSLYPSLSSDGAFIAFHSMATNLVPMDNNFARDVFVYEAQTGTITRVSVGPFGLEANNDSRSAAISADGRFVAFLSAASNLVPAVDGNGTLDVFVHDRVTGVTELVSVGLGGMSGNGASGDPSSTPPTISADGRWVAFHSDAADLVTLDNNGVRDVFVRDRQSQTTIRVSVDSLGIEGDDTSEHAGVSPDGRWVTFTSLATNLDVSMPATDRDIYLHDLWTSTTTAITAGAWCQWPRPSWDAEFVSFDSTTPLVVNDTNGGWDCYVYDRASGATSRVSVRTGGFQAQWASGASTISHDGRFIAFQSTAGNLVLDDTNLLEDVFVHDRATAVTARVSVGTGGTQAFGGPSQLAAISPDGRLVGFQSAADNLFQNDFNGAVDVFVHGPGPLGTHYCGPSVANSTGLPSSITASGLGVAGWRLTLAASGLPPNQFGYFLASQTPGYSNPSGSMGFLCLSGTIGRFNAAGQVGLSSAAGSFEVLIDTSGIPVNPPQPVLSGQTWNFQAWYRDWITGLGATSNFTEGISVVFQ